LSFLALSCGDSEYEYSSHRAYFNFDNATRLDPVLMTAMNPVSPGIFCKISISNGSYFVFQNNQGQSSRQNMTALDRQRTIILGAYNESGIIVGYGTLDQPPTFYAYDAQCPNCYSETNLPRYVLTMTTDGKAVCSRCGRKYNMANGGIICEGENGSKLIRYRASTTGPTGVLSVNN